MKKIVFVLALFLAMNPLVSVADSSASAKSSNCTVNTCELTVTATPDPYGILLRWNFTESDYEVSINRDGAFVPKFIPAKNGFWRDTSAKYGVIHKYIISIGSMSKTIEATRGSGVAPTISKLEVAPLWLVNEGPYNVRVTISDHYDHNRYQIKGIYFTILGKTKIWRDYNPSGVYNLYGFINSFILSCYGKYELIAQCEYKERVSGNEYVSKKGGKECEADVFVYFHKYGGTKKRPNWYENWKKDKVVDLDGFEYIYNLGEGVQGKYGGGSWVREKVASLGYFQTFDGYYRNYPAIYKYKHKSGKLQIGPEAAAESRDLPSLGVGKDGVGVVACAIVSTHEREHLATQRDLYSGRYEDISNMTQEFIDALGKTIDLVDCDSNVKKYYSELCNFWKAKKEDALCKDLDFDGVRDAREADYGLTVGDRDTKKIHMLYLGNAQAKDIYAATGDNEYIARDAEKKYGSYMKKGKDKDWAFPGRQIASQYQGLKEYEWNNIKDNQIKQLSKEYFPNSAKLNSAITQSMMTKETDLVDAHDVGGCFAVDDLPEIEAEGMTKNIVVESISEGIAKGEDGSYSGLVFKIGIRTRDNVTNDIVITGWLVDSDGNAVAKAYKYAYEINGKKELELCFEGEMLYKQGGSGYLLRYLTIESQSVNGYNALHDVRIDAGRSVQTYFASDFAPCSAYLKNQEIISSIVDEGLNLTVPVEICSNGVYCISALLKTKDGANVAESTCTTTGLGTKNITLVFPRKNIFLSKQNGPYILRKIELRDENGACIDSAWDVHATEAYSYRDFADGSETIFADVESFSRESDLIGADGLCDALNFSFAVTNLTSSTTEYIARIYLCGTNDEHVCSSAKTIVLSNSVNMVHIPFRGYEIKERNIEGPYYVSEVLIEDAGDGGVVERFNPKQILIERSLSEFGSVPVSINGEFSLAAGTRDTPFVVEVPVNAVRPGTIRASAILVSTNGTPVVAAESSREFTVGENGVLTLTFNAADINASGVRGPYMIKYLVLSSEYDGVEEIHVDDLGLGVLQRDFILYVDASKEDDSGDGFSPATAKATIHGAVRVANPFDTILVADGVYEPIECEVSGLTIRSINGAEATIIDGEDQCRCVELWGGYQEIYDEETDEWYFVSGEDSVIEGFTLRNGWTRGSGAGIYGGIVRNCIITGCNAVGNEGWDESGTGGGAADATLENCIIYGNFAAGDGGGTSGCKLYNCTVSANKADNGAGGIACSEAYNSIVYGNVGATKLTNEYDSDSTWNGSVFEYSCTYPLPLSGSGNIDADPLLVNPLYGDVHLRSASLCIDAGSDVLGNLEFDFYGNSRIQGDSPEMGAIEGCFEDRLSVTATVKGVGSVSPQSILVEPGGSVTFTARSDTRDFLAFEINGTRVSEEMRFTVDNIENDISVVAVFKPGTLYVSSSGSDDNSGLSWSHAKATIQGAIDACEDGETIFVWSGSYAPFISENKAVTIRSMYGASETVIDAKGMGACAFMGGSVGETNTVLIGFTLQNGFVSGSGGGARGGTLQDCVIVNNSAGLSGGGVLYSTATRCVISNNVIIANLSYIEDDLWGVIECCGGGAYDSLLNNCLICDNIIDARQVKRGYLGGGGICNGKLYNCTVVGNAILCNPKDEVPVDDNGDYEEESGVYTYGGGVADGSAYNTIIWDNYINELVDNDYYVDKINCLEEGVDPMLVPGRFELSSDSVCIDAGNDQYVFVDMDVGGNKRIVGNSVDIGAYEYFEINKEITYSIVFISNGGEGQMEDMTCVFGDKQNLTENRFYRIGYVFMGWSVSEEGDVIYTDRQEIYNLTDKSNGYVKLYAQWQPENCHFMQDAMTVKESGNIIIEILGGNENVASSVKLYLTYNTTSAADIDFANGLVWNVGAAVHYQTGLKFPLTLTWAAGEIGEKTITIPIKADKAIEDAEQFTLQLADPVGMELGEARLCTVTITDPGYAELEAKIAAGAATKAEKTAWDKLQKAKAPYIRGVADPANAGKVTGSGLCASGKKVTLKATANKGYVFTGWLKSQIALDGDRLVTNAVKYVATTPSLVIDRTAKPAKDTATSTTLTNVNENATFYAAFITTDEDKAAVGLTLNGGKVPQVEGSVLSLTTNIMCGVALNWPLASSALSATTVKVAGLPAGLKFTAKDIMKKGSKTEVEIPANTIYGAPTAASKIDKKTGLPVPSAVKVTVTTAGKSSVTYLMNITVDALPAWAVGNFEGFVSLDENDGGFATMSITAAGKLSGKIAYGGTNWTFKDDSFAVASETVGYTNFAIRTVATSGKAALDLSLNMVDFLVDSLPSSTTSFAEGYFGEVYTMMYRLPWMDKGDTSATSLIASYAGAYSCRVPYGDDSGDVTFVLDEKGAVKGTVVLPDGDKTRKATFACNVLPNYDSLSVVIALPPDLKKGYPDVFKVVNLVNYSGEGADDLAFRDPGVVAAVAELTAESGATGTVSVNPKYGQVAPGKDVTLTAKAAKGSVFHRWKITGVDTEGLDLSSATLKFKITDAGDVFATAVFATTQEDVASLALDLADAITETDGAFLLDLGACVSSLSFVKLTVAGLPTGLKYDAKTMTISGKATKPGLYAVKVTATNASATGKKAVVGQFTIEVPNFTAANGYFVDNLDNGIGKKRVLSVGISNIDDFLPSLRMNSPTAKLAVSGLPSGLKYDAKTGKITGVATKSGTYTVTLTVTDGKAKYVSTITIEVEALPDWVVGTFNGGGYFGDIDEDEPDDYGAYHTLMTMTISADGKVSAKCTFDDGYVEGWSESQIFEVVTNGNDSYALVRLYEPKWESSSSVGWGVWAKIQPTADGFGVVELWNDSFTNQITCPMEWFVGVMEQNVFLRAEYKNALTELGVVGTYANLSDDGFKTHPGGGGGIVDATLTISANGQLKLVGLHEPNWDISDPAKKITATGTLLPSGIGYVMATDRSERYCYFAAVNVKVNPLSGKPVIEISSWVVGEEYFGRWVDGYENGFNGNVP